MLGSDCFPCCQAGICEPEFVFPYITLAYEILDGMDGSFPARPATAWQTGLPGFGGYVLNSGPIQYANQNRTQYTEGSALPECPSVLQSQAARYVTPAPSQTPGTAYEYFATINGLIEIQRTGCDANSFSYSRFSGQVLQFQFGVINVQMSNGCRYSRAGSAVNERTTSSSFTLAEGKSNGQTTLNAQNVFGNSVTWSGSNVTTTTNAESGTTFPITVYGKARVYAYRETQFGPLLTRYQEIKIRILGIFGPQLQTLFFPPYGPQLRNLP